MSASRNHVRHSFGIFLLFPLFIVLNGCVTVGDQSEELGSSQTGEPGWWVQPKQDDAISIYVKASASGTSEEEARRRAYDCALAHIAKRISANVNSLSAMGGLDFSVSSNLEIRGSRIEHEHIREHGPYWTAWLLVTCPRTELDRQQEILNAPRDKFEQAVQYLEAGDLVQSEATMRGLLALCPIGKQRIFPTDLAWFYYAMVLEKNGFICHAYDAYQSVLSLPGVSNEVIVKANPRLDQLQDKTTDHGWVSERLKSRTVALVAYNKKSDGNFAHGNDLVEWMERLYGIRTVLVDASGADHIRSATRKTADLLLELGFEWYPVEAVKAQGKGVFKVEWDAYNVKTGSCLGKGTFATLPVPDDAKRKGANIALNILVQKKLRNGIDWSF
jgi:hypothetical protein